jgi:translation initiation factor 2B subunit (eIF-2B alpha/beta/delta family)
MDVSRDHLLGLFAEFYREHAAKTVKNASSKVKKRVTAPLAEKKEKFLVEVFKNNQNILSIAAQKNVTLENLARNMRRQLEDFSRLNDQLNLLVS